MGPKLHVDATVAALLAACNPTPLRLEPVGGTTGGPIDTASGAPPATRVPPTTGRSTTGGSTGGTARETDDDDGDSFLLPPDGPSPLECSIWDQDCAAGEKCSPYTIGDGWGWNAARCVPIASDPRQGDEPCTVKEGPTTGLDDCDFGLVCVWVDADTLSGFCLPLCTVSVNNPICEDPDRICQGGDSSIWCLELCDPLGLGCPPGFACYPVSSHFGCIPDRFGVAGYGETCTWHGECLPGLACVPPAHVPGCFGFDCCSPLCDVTGQNSCRGLGQECVPWYVGGAQPGLDDVGVCGVRR